MITFSDILLHEVWHLIAWSQFPLIQNCFDPIITKSFRKALNPLFVIFIVP